MRAIRLEEIGQLDLVDIPESSPAVDEIVIETIATGICGSDIHGYTGENGRRTPGQVMGHETVGRIVQIGKGVDPERFRLGSLVTVNPVILPASERDEYRGREQHNPHRRVLGVDPGIVSAFAERFAVPMANVVVLPEMENPLLAALIEPLAVALHAAHRVGVGAGMSVLVVGGGPIGQSCVLAAFREGAERVIVSEPSSGRRAICADLGAEVVNPDEGSVPDVVLRLTAGRGVDLAIDAVGLSATISDALKSTALGGRVCLVGMAQPNVALEAYRVTTDERTLVGSFTYPARTFEEAAKWVAEGSSRLDALVSAVIDPEQADRAFSRLATATDIPGKVLIRFSAEVPSSGALLDGMD